MMKTVDLKYLLLILLLCATVLCKAQTVNLGELSISPGAIMSSLGVMDNTSTGEVINDGDLYLYDHYNNDGIIGFTSGLKTGTTRMTGVKGAQEISGSIIMEWYNVEFNNTNEKPLFDLSNEVRISGKANFKKGIVDNETHGGLVVFESGSEHLDTSDASYVEGEVKKNGKEAFYYPVGSNGKYRPMAMSAPDNALETFNGRHEGRNSNAFYSHSNKEEGIERIDEAEYWILEKMSGKSNIFLTLTWNEDTTDSEIYQKPYDEIHIVRWDVIEQKWVDEGGVVDEHTKEVKMVIDPVNGYGIFALARVKGQNFLPCGGKGVEIFNAVSANDDGFNDYFNIAGIENCTNNTVEIYNRWGVKVFETSAYNTNGNVFKGFSEGRVTVNKEQKLPEGTYFYIINIEGDSKGKEMKKAGYLYLNH